MHHFFAYMSRMRYIRRWSLMRNTQPENIQEHSLQVAMIAHALALIGNMDYGKAYDIGRVATLALYHEASEVITGDLPTPVKYFSHKLRASYSEMEALANRRLLDMLPERLRGTYEGLLEPPSASPERALVKAADRICAYLKCVEEQRSGNAEFTRAGQAIIQDIQALDLPEVQAFMRDFEPSFHLSLDELQ